MQGTVVQIQDFIHAKHSPNHSTLFYHNLVLKAEDIKDIKGILSPPLRIKNWDVYIYLNNQVDSITEEIRAFLEYQSIYSLSCY